MHTEAIRFIKLICLSRLLLLLFSTLTISTRRIKRRVISSMENKFQKGMYIDRQLDIIKLYQIITYGGN